MKQILNPKSMILVVGLGNPGKKYENTRHNIGFRVIDEFAKKNNFPDFHFAKKHNAEISEDNLDVEEGCALFFNLHSASPRSVNEKIILAKPQTFMNNSGKAVKLLIKTYCVNKAMAKLTQHLLVVHDDIDLPLGKIKIVKNRGSAGHKGVESIIQAINSKDFIRIRIGILAKTGKPKNPEYFVLQRFDNIEKKIIKELIRNAAGAIETIIKDGLEKATNQCN